MKKMPTEDSPTRELLDQIWVRKIFEKLSSPGVEESAQVIGELIFTKLYQQAVIEKNARNESKHLIIPEKISPRLLLELRDLFVTLKANPSLKDLDKPQQASLANAIKKLDQEDFIKVLGSMIQLHNQVSLKSSTGSDSGDTASKASDSSDEEADKTNDDSTEDDFQKRYSPEIEELYDYITESDDSLETASDESIDIEHAVNPRAPLKAFQVKHNYSEGDWKTNLTFIISYLTVPEIRDYFVNCSKTGEAPTKENIVSLLDDIEMGDIKEKSDILFKAYYVLKENPTLAAQINIEYSAMISNVITRTATTVSLKRSSNRSGADSITPLESPSIVPEVKEGFLNKLSFSSVGIQSRRSSISSLSASSSPRASPMLKRKEKTESLKKDSVAKLTELEKEFMELALKDSNKIRTPGK